MKSSCTRQSLSPCPNLNLIHYKKAACTFVYQRVQAAFLSNPIKSQSNRPNFRPFWLAHLPPSGYPASRCCA
ncbi:hypothetical protein GB851_07055 [Kingella kingae]|nr:hypothetical protein GB851_07055 [Kingella kingae]